MCINPLPFVADLLEKNSRSLGLVIQITHFPLSRAKKLITVPLRFSFFRTLYSSDLVDQMDNYSKIPNFSEFSRTVRNCYSCADNPLECENCEKGAKQAPFFAQALELDTFAGFSLSVPTGQLAYWTYLLLFLLFSLAFAETGRCSTPDETQFSGRSSENSNSYLGQNPTPPKKKGNILTPIVNFLKKDNDDEERILDGKPVSFVPAPVSAPPPAALPVPGGPVPGRLPQQNVQVGLGGMSRPAAYGVPGYPPPQALPQGAALGQVRAAEPQPYAPPGFANPATAQIAGPQTGQLNERPSDTPEVRALIADLKTATGTDWAHAGKMVDLLRQTDRSKIPPDLYQYLVQRTRAELLPVVSTPVEQDGAETLARLEQAARNKAVSKPNIPAPIPTVSTPTPKKKKSVARGIEDEESDEDEYDARFSPVAAGPDFSWKGPFAKKSDVPVGQFAKMETDERSRRVPNARNTSGETEWDDRETARETASQVAYRSNGFVRSPSVNQAGYNQQPEPYYGSGNGPGRYVPEDLEAGPAEWEQIARAAAESLKTKINLSRDPEEAANDEMRLRLLEVALGKQQGVREPISGLDEPVRNFFSNELFGIGILLNEHTTPDVNARCLIAQPHFLEAQQQLQRACPLRIRNMQFVKEWGKKFGDYTPAKPELQADTPALLYFELENLTGNGSETTGFSTKISVNYEILDATGATIAKSESGTNEELLRSRLRDYSTTLQIRLPASIPAGHYFVVLRVVDQNHLKLQMDSQRVGFTVLSKRQSNDAE